MKDKILSLLKECPGYVSGEKICKKFGVSRTAVWKHINQLREEGYLIESSSKKGYILIKTPDVLTYEEIKDLLKTKYVGRKMVYLETASSTNDVVKQMALSGENEGLVVIAEQQTAGRGRMGRFWNTYKGESIAMSILLRPEINPQLAPSITPVLAVSTVEAIRKETGINAKIKWPNDIVLDGKKLGGILTEMNAEMDLVNYIIVGMGININQEYFDESVSNIASSLRMYSGNNYDRKKLLARILNIFEEHYELFKKQGLAPFVDYLKEYSVIIGREVTVTDMRGSIKGTAVDIDADGGILIKVSGGKIVKIYSGDVTTSGLYKI